jgi:hypothetical protein
MMLKIYVSDWCSVPWSTLMIQVDWISEMSILLEQSVSQLRIDLGRS